MKTHKISLAALLGLMFCVLLFTPGIAGAANTDAKPKAAAPAAPATPKAVLTIDDCVKCHDEEPKEIAEAGSAHRDAINCQDCHTGHRPRSANNIPQCSNCHEGTAHFKLDKCLRCHNPHEPLNVKLEGDLKAECVTCHTEENQQMVANPSKHATFACNFCHAEKHGVIPECVQCHDSHSKDITKTDCNTCHQAHQPLVLKYPDSTKNIFCAACHDDVYKMLQATKTKHHDVACVSCHANKHKTIPKCSDCHGMPHAEGIHKKFPVCGSCHNIAHDLNNFSDVPAKAKDQKTKEKKK